MLYARVGTMIRFRPFDEGDFAVMLDWLQRAHVKQWWDDGDDTLDKVSEHYSHDGDAVFRYIVYGHDESRVGFIQYYIESEDTVGVDLFIGEPDSLGRGLGAEIMTAFVALIDQEYGPRNIVIDPDPNNQRAIRCYEKAGFHFDRIGLNSEGKPAYFMKMERDV